MSKRRMDNLQIVFATSAGDIRRNALSDFTNVRSNGKIATDLKEGTELVNARIAGEEDDVMLLRILKSNSLFNYRRTSVQRPKINRCKRNQALRPG